MFYSEGWNQELDCRVYSGILLRLQGTCFRSNKLNSTAVSVSHRLFSEAVDLTLPAWASLLWGHPACESPVFVSQSCGFPVLGFWAVLPSCCACCRCVSAAARHEQNSPSPRFNVGAESAALSQLITICGLSKMKIVLFGIFPGLLQASLGLCLWKVRMCMILFEHDQSSIGISWSPEQPISSGSSLLCCFQTEAKHTQGSISVPFILGKTMAAPRGFESCPQLTLQLGWPLETSALRLGLNHSSRNAAWPSSPTGLSRGAVLTCSSQHLHTQFLPEILGWFQFLPWNWGGM